MEIAVGKSTKDETSEVKVKLCILDLRVFWAEIGFDLWDPWKKLNVFTVTWNKKMNHIGKLRWTQSECPDVLTFWLQFRPNCEFSKTWNPHFWFFCYFVSSFPRPKSSKEIIVLANWLCILTPKLPRKNSSKQSLCLKLFERWNIIESSISSILKEIAVGKSTKKKTSKVQVKLWILDFWLKHSNFFEVEDFDLWDLWKKLNVDLHEIKI